MRSALPFKPARLTQHEKAHLVKSVHIAFGLLIVACAVSVRPHFLQKRDLISGDVGGHGKTRKSKVLMGAHAVYVGRLAVEEQSLVDADLHCPKADFCRGFVDGFSVQPQCGFNGIQMGAVTAPQKRVDGDGTVPYGACLAQLYGSRTDADGGNGTVRTDNTAFGGHGFVCIIRVHDRGFKIDLPAVVVELFIRCIHAPQINSDCLCYG